MALNPEKLVDSKCQKAATDWGPSPPRKMPNPQVLGNVSLPAITAAAPAPLAATGWPAPPWRYQPVAALAHATDWRFLRQSRHPESGCARRSDFLRTFA